jgi:UDP-N-acetylmuramate dehydrogenase
MWRQVATREFFSKCPLQKSTAKEAGDGTSFAAERRGREYIYVNRGGASASDVLRLIEYIQQTVLRETGVSLEPEIRCVQQASLD